MLLSSSKCVKIKSSSIFLRKESSYKINILSQQIQGVILTSDLSWQEQTGATCGKMSQKLSALRHFGAALNVKTHAHLFKTFVKPDFEYGLPVWSN